MPNVMHFVHIYLFYLYQFLFQLIIVLFLYDLLQMLIKEIDFLGMFKVPPDSDYGKIMYENPKKRNGLYVQPNYQMYQTYLV